MASTGEVVRGVFFQHLPTKLVALLVAFALWWYIGYELTATDKFTVPVTVTLDTDSQGHWRLLGDPDHSVRIALEGPRQIIEQLEGQVGQIRGVVNISRDELLSQTDAEVPWSVKLEPKHFALPFARLKVVGIEPDTFQVKLGQLGSEWVEVSFSGEADLKKKYTGEPKPGFAVTGVEVRPTRVKVTGPLGVIAKLKKVLPLAPIDVTDADSDVSQLADLAKDVAQQLEWAGKRPTVTARVAVLPVERKLTVPIQWSYAPEYEEKKPADVEWDFFQKTIEVTLRGPKELVGAVEEGDVLARAYVAPATVKEWPKPGHTAPAVAELRYAFVDRARFPGVEIRGRDSMDFRVVRKAAPEKPAGAGTGAPPGNSGGSGDGDHKPGGGESGDESGDRAGAGDGK